MPKFVVPVDLTKQEIQNAKLQNIAGDYSSPVSGDKGLVWYNTSTNTWRGWDGTANQTLSTILEGVTGTAPIVAGAISGKSQAISIVAASASVPGSMTAAHYSLVNGATNANTASTLVQRDGSGNFIAGTITAALTGTASNATNLTPTADIAMGSHKITGLTDPTAAQDAATKFYVDSVATGLDIKASVRLTSVSAVTVTYANTGGTSGRGQITGVTNSVDGTTVVAGNRVLLKNQATPAQNGIWVVTTAGSGANGVWDRATDFDQDAEVTGGAFTFIEEGTQAGTGWVLTTPNPIVIGGASGTSLTFAQFSGAGAYTAGNGLLLTGSAFSVVGTTNRVSVSGAGVDISSAYVGQSTITTLGTVTTGTWTGTSIALANGGTGATTAAAARTNLNVVGKAVITAGTGIVPDAATTPVANSAATLGNASLTSFVVTHDRGTKDVQVVLTEVATDAEVFANVTHTSTTTVTIAFATAPTSAQYRLVILG